MTANAYSATPTTATTHAPAATRHFYLDVLRLFAVISVIFLHVSSIHFYELPTLGPSAWLASDLHHSLWRACIPVFFFLTGATLLPSHRQESWRHFFTHRYWRLLLPFLCWQVIYQCFLHGWQSLSSLAAWQAIFFGHTAYHLWYMQAALLVYLLIPPLRAFCATASRSLLRYTILVWLAVVFGYRFYQFVFGLPLTPPRYFLDFSGLLLLGHYLHNAPASSRARSRLVSQLALPVFLTSAALMVWGSWFSSSHGGFNSYWTDNLSIFVLLNGLATFIFLRDHEVGCARLVTWPATRRLWRSFLCSSFGIYLVHLLILTSLQRGYLGGFPLTGDWPSLWLGIPLLTFTVFILSWLACALLQKIPFLRRIIS